MKLEKFITDMWMFYFLVQCQMFRNRHTERLLRLTNSSGELNNSKIHGISHLLDYSYLWTRYRIQFDGASKLCFTIFIYIIFMSTGVINRFLHLLTFIGYTLSINKSDFAQIEMSLNKLHKQVQVEVLDVYIIWLSLQGFCFCSGFSHTCCLQHFSSLTWLAHFYKSLPSFYPCLSQFRSLTLSTRCSCSAGNTCRMWHTFHTGWMYHILQFNKHCSYTYLILAKKFRSP